MEKLEKSGLPRPCKVGQREPLSKPLHLIGSIRAAADQAPAVQEAAMFRVIGFGDNSASPVINSTNYLGDPWDWGKQDHDMRIP